jgi:hypothetical protein
MIKHALRVAVAAIGFFGCGAGNGTPAPQTLEDMEFSGFVDIAVDDQPRTIRLSDYYAENRPGTRIIMLSAAAGWCAPCMREASAMPDFAATYEPRGVAILTAVFQDQNGDPADAEFVRIWAETFDLTVPVLIDSSFQTGRYFDAGTMPAHMFVDAETLEILKIATGAGTGDDAMQEYRALLDYYLQ